MFTVCSGETVMSSSWGENVRISVFGQSHGAAVGVVIDGLPAGEPIDLQMLQRFLDRRAPGRSALTTARAERDIPAFLSGLLDGVTCGAPLCAVLENRDTRAIDYAALRDLPRPGHADYTAQLKYGGFQDAAGGGHFSGRLTAPLCVAGGIALQLLSRRGVHIAAHIARIGTVSDTPFDTMHPATVPEGELPVLDPEKGAQMREQILSAASDGDSLGGVVECQVSGLEAGYGGPLFGGLEGKLAAALFAIPAVKGVEFGEGFHAAALTGSENNDPYTVVNGAVVPATNHAGGILGGISTGLPILLHVAFKPTPSIAKAQQTASFSTHSVEELQIGGRHDPCIVPRAVPVVEAVTALVMLDVVLGQR